MRAFNSGQNDTPPSRLLGANLVVDGFPRHPEIHHCGVSTAMPSPPGCRRATRRKPPQRLLSNITFHCRVPYTEVVVGQLFARLADGKLGKEVENHLPRLFTEHSARLVRNDDREYSEPRSFDHAVATVATTDLELRFVRVRGELSIDIAIPGEHRKWQALDSALAWFDAQRGTKSHPILPNWGYEIDGSSFDWPCVDRFLADNWERMHVAAREPSISRRCDPS